MRSWLILVRHSGGSGACLHEWWCTCCWPGACSPSWATGRSGIVLWPGSMDGTIMSVPDSPANLTRYGKQRGGVTGGSSYPMLRLVAVVACGTRTIIDAVFGPISHGETTYARQLTDSLRRGMLVLADRNFAAGYLLAAVAGTGAHMLVRAR